MSSPFPGMDPYLEHPAIFPGFHDSMVTYLRESLQGVLPEPYYAEISDRLWVEVSDRAIEPDVNVLRREEESAEPPDSGEMAVAVETATGSEPVVIVVPREMILHDEFREPYVDIMTRIEGRERIVTTIEVLSLTNKSPGKRGRELYLQKQSEVLDSQVHLIEIDLLRAGEHTTAVPLARLRKKVGRFDYHVCLHPFDQFEKFYVYPFTIREALPEIAVPLLPGDKPVPLDLQQAFHRCYETGPYQRRVRYGEVNIDPPLSEADAQWAAQLLQKTH